MGCKHTSRDMFGKGLCRPIPYPNAHANMMGVASSRVGKHHNVPPPKCPGDNGFCEMMDEVVDVRASVTRGDWPTEFLDKHFPWQSSMSEQFDGTHIPEPILDAGVDFFDPEAAAALVRMDWPTDLGVFVYQYLRRQGVPLRSDGEEDFVDNTIGFTARLSMHLWYVIEKVFEVKWYYGAVRPEEYYGMDGCVFTAYTEGCPKHPAYIAGHGALAGAIRRFLEQFFDFSNHCKQQDELISAVYHFAQYRTFAGVHTAQDNVEGLKFGYSLDIKPLTKP